MAQFSSSRNEQLPEFGPYLSAAKEAAGRTRAIIYFLFIATIAIAYSFPLLGRPDWTYERIQLYRRAYEFSSTPMLSNDQVANPGGLLAWVKARSSDDAKQIYDLAMKAMAEERQATPPTTPDKPAKQEVTQEAVISACNERILSEYPDQTDASAPKDEIHASKRRRARFALRSKIIQSANEYCFTRGIKPAPLEEYRNIPPIIIGQLPPVSGDDAIFNQRNVWLLERISKLEATYAEQRHFTIPVVGVTIDTSDMMSMGGLTLTLLMIILGLCALNEAETIRKAVEVASSYHEIDLILSTQVYSRPRQPGSLAAFFLWLGTQVCFATPTIVMANYWNYIHSEKSYTVRSVLLNSKMIPHNVVHIGLVLAVLAASLLAYAAWLELTESVGNLRTLSGDLRRKPERRRFEALISQFVRFWKRHPNEHWAAEIQAAINHWHETWNDYDFEVEEQARFALTRTCYVSVRRQYGAFFRFRIAGRLASVISGSLTRQ